MKIKTLLMAVLSVAVLNAAEPAKPAAAQPAAPAAKPAAEPAKPAAPAVPTADELLKGLPEVVSTADGKPLVTRAELLEVLKPGLENALEEAKKGGAPIPKASQVKEACYGITESLSLNKLATRAAEKAGVKLDKAAAEKQVAQMETEMNKQKPGFFAEQLKEAGMTREQLVSRMAEQAQVQAFLGSLVEKAPKSAPVTEADAKKFYDEHPEQFQKPASFSASHILVQFPNQKPSADEKAAALKKIQGIRAQLKEDGANFAEIAKANSDCPSKAQGGSLGEFGAGQMVKEFEDALLKLKENEISQPVETMFGYHIIKAGKRTPEHKQSFDEVKAPLMQFLGRQKEGANRQKVVRDFVEKLKADSKLVIQLPKPAEEEKPAAKPAAK